MNASNLDYKKMALVALCSFLAPVAHIFIIGGNAVAAARIGLGMALASIVGFIQDPKKVS